MIKQVKSIHIPLDIHTKLKEEACNRVGIYYRYFKYEEDTPELTIVNKIKELNNDDYVNGIMLELPIPDKYNEKRLLNSILNTKDIDGLTDVNIGRLISGRKTFVPCTVAAIMTIIKENTSLCSIIFPPQISLGLGVCNLLHLQ